MAIENAVYRNILANTTFAQVVTPENIMEEGGLGERNKTAVKTRSKSLILCSAISPTSDVFLCVHHVRASFNEGAASLEGARLARTLKLRVALKLQYSSRHLMMMMCTSVLFGSPLRR